MREAGKASLLECCSHSLAYLGSYFVYYIEITCLLALVIKICN